MSSQKMQKMEIGSDQKARVGISRNQRFGLDLLNKVYSKTADPSFKGWFFRELIFIYLSFVTLN